MEHRSKWDLEETRILNAYAKRHAGRLLASEFFGHENLAHIFRIQERHRATLFLLEAHGFTPLTAARILDIGCGDGSMLREFLQWGAEAANLAGLELRPEPVKKAQCLSPNIDIRCGSATELPWPDTSFDLVCQHTVFTSVLDATMKQQIVAEMGRVLRHGGGVLWYDFMYNNPRNPDVQGISAGEIRQLFPGFQITLHRITLAPFIARRLPVPTLPVLYPLLAAVPFLKTHYLGMLLKPTLGH